MIACAAIVACAAATAARPAVSLVASPSRVVLSGTARETVALRNSGGRRVVVEVVRSGYALDLRGRPHVVRNPPRAWFRVQPARLVLAPGATASLRIASTAPKRREPGDHTALLLLTTRPLHAAAVAFRMRLGVVVVVRVPGRIVRRLALLGLRVHGSRGRRALELLVANRGNVTESVNGACLRLQLRRRGRILATLRPVPRELLPRTRGLVAFRLTGRMRAHTTALVIGRPGCALAAGRRFVLRR